MPTIVNSVGLRKIPAELKHDGVQLGCGWMLKESAEMEVNMLFD